jgi:hypothetical protein
MTKRLRKVYRERNEGGKSDPANCSLGRTQSEPEERKVSSTHAYYGMSRIWTVGSDTATLPCWSIACVTIAIDRIAVT